MGALSRWGNASSGIRGSRPVRPRPGSMAVETGLMTLQGDEEYALHFNETDALSVSQKRYAETQFRLFKTWWAGWRGAEA